MKNFTDKQQTKKAIIPNTFEKLLKEYRKEAVDPFDNQKTQQYWKAVLFKAAGLWKNRNDLPDFNRTRSEWDRLKMGYAISKLGL